MKLKFREVNVIYLHMTKYLDDCFHFFGGIQITNPMFVAAPVESDLTANPISSQPTGISSTLSG